MKNHNEIASKMLSLSGHAFPMRQNSKAVKMSGENVLNTVKNFIVIIPLHYIKLHKFGMIDSDLLSIASFKGPEIKIFNKKIQYFFLN